MLGLLADLMLKDTLTSQVPIGLGVPILACAAAAAIIYMSCATKLPRQLKSLGFLAPVLLFSLGFIFRDSPTLLMIDLGVVFTGLAFTAASLSGAKLTAGSITQYFGALLVGALSPVMNTIDLFMNEIHWPAVVPESVKTMLSSVIKGLAIATPLVAVFFALFVAADPAFAAIAGSVLKVDFKDLFIHLGIVCTFAWLSAGYLHGISVFKADHDWGDSSAMLNSSATSRATSTATSTADSALNLDLARPVETYRPSAPQLGGTEMATVLGLLNLLFAAFVAVQIKYLFGGASLVSLTPGLTYADYVHKGFTELNTVVALVLPLLLIADVVFVRKTRGGETLFRVNAGMLIGLVMIILASAMQRMSLYQTEYGQSELRLYVTVFMTWLGTVCAIFAATVLNGNRQRFAFASYASGVAILALVNLANPDAMIEASNIKMAHAKGNFDVNYALALSNDAIPTLLSQLDALPEESQRAVAMKLLTQKRGAWKTDWRNLNFSRMAAYQAVVDNTKKLERIAGLERPVTL